MARDGTNRGGRRVRAGDKPAPAAEKIQKGQQVQILNNDIPTLSPTELEAVDLPEGAVMNGVDMPKPSDYLSARQKNGIPLGADEIYKETWLWLKDRNCEKLVNPLGDWTGGTGVDITVSLIILPKQMRNGCRHWTGTLFVLSQDGTTRNTKAEIICRKWDLLGIAFTKKD